MSEKKNSYDKFWLYKDMENMGYIFEYCDKYCKQLFNKDIDKKEFIKEFMNSKCRHEMEIGHPTLLSQSAYDTVEDFVKVDMNSDINKFIRNDKGDDKDFYSNQLYWVGWMYAYIHYEKDILSKDLIKIIPVEEMISLYYLGHEMDKTVVLDKLEDKFR